MDDDSAPDTPRDSGMRIAFSLVVEYTRRRAVVSDRWEARLTTVGLLLIGGAITLVFIVVIVPRILAAVGLV